MTENELKALSNEQLLQAYDNLNVAGSRSIEAFREVSGQVSAARAEILKRLKKS